MVGAIAIYLWLRGITVRDWVFLALIVVLGLAVVYVFLYIRHYEKKSETLTKIPEAPKPTEEILFILEVLASIAAGYSSRGGLQVIYEKTFKGQEVDEFAAVIGALHGSKLIRYSEPPMNQEGIHLTDEGSTYYLKHKKQLKKK